MAWVGVDAGRCIDADVFYWMMRETWNGLGAIVIVIDSASGGRIQFNFQFLLFLFAVFLDDVIAV